MKWRIHKQYASSHSASTSARKDDALEAGRSRRVARIAGRRADLRQRVVGNAFVHLEASSGSVAGRPNRYRRVWTRSPMLSIRAGNGFAPLQGVHSGSSCQQRVIRSVQLSNWRASRSDAVEVRSVDAACWSSTAIGVWNAAPGEAFVATVGCAPPFPWHLHAPRLTSGGMEGSAFVPRGLRLTRLFTPISPAKVERLRWPAGMRHAGR